MLWALPAFRMNLQEKKTKKPKKTVFATRRLS